jgi:hypothetical protein
LNLAANRFGWSSDLLSLRGSVLAPFSQSRSTRCVRRGSPARRMRARERGADVTTTVASEATIKNHAAFIAGRHRKPWGSRSGA